MSRFFRCSLLASWRFPTIIGVLASASTYSILQQKRPLRNDSHSTWAKRDVNTGSRTNKFTGRPGDGSLQEINSGGDSDSIDRSEDREDDVPIFDDNDSAALASFSKHFTAARKSISSIQWSSLGDITDMMVPKWVQELPEQVKKLETQFSMAQGSLADEIWQEAQDPEVHPEIKYKANVRFGKDLSKEELDFKARRKRHVTKSLAQYLGVSERDVEPDDVPTIAMCGSGGGLRALVSGASSYLSAQEAGLFDCVTYTAGVSGSCWLQTLYYSSVGGQRHTQILDHLKKRLHVHIAYPPTALSLFTQAPTNKFLLSGCVEKLQGNSTAKFGLVDLYGLLLAARLLVPRGDLAVNSLDLKISNQRSYLKRGEHPLPIYTAVRHEIPIESKNEIEESQIPDSAKENAQKEAWFQWFEFTPYELWCEELAAGIPTYAIGRRFERGSSVSRRSGTPQPETRLPLLMGIWGSAFCATLSHYYKEIRPLVKGLAGFQEIDGLVEDRNDDLVKIHPIDPAAIPNYAIGLNEGQLSSTTPKSIFSVEHLQLMDAGMSNNLPIYPLLRDGRDVDIIIAFDASADIKTENWLSVADGYAKQRGVKGWPTGAGWPKRSASQVPAKADLDAAEGVIAQQAGEKVPGVRETQGTRSKDKQERDADLGYCNVWVGTSVERESEDEPPQSKRVDPDADWKLSAPDAGIAVIYFPFLPNPKVHGVDPNTSDFMSTWNFIYTPEDIDKVVSLARANFSEGSEQTKRTIRAVYERKRARRLKLEEQKSIHRWKRELRDSGDHFG